MRPTRPPAFDFSGVFRFHLNHRGAKDKMEDDLLINGHFRPKNFITLIKQQMGELQKT
jgi:hypothetical protein